MRVHLTLKKREFLRRPKRRGEAKAQIRLRRRHEVGRGVKRPGNGGKTCRAPTKRSVP